MKTWNEKNDNEEKWKQLAYYLILIIIPMYKYIIKYFKIWLYNLWV